MEDRIFYYHGISEWTGKDFPRRFTLAVKFTDDDDVIVGISICSPLDQFIKKVGRKKAEGRLVSQVGNFVTSLYSVRFFKPKKKSKGFKLDWFLGKEVKITIKLGKKLEKMSFSELKQLFDLKQH